MVVWEPRMTSRTNKRRTTCQGITLLELILVMALMVVIASLAMPAMRGVFRRQMLRKAGEQIRVEWAKARNAAMRSGRIMVFEYQVGASMYRIRPWARQTDLVEGDLTALGTRPGSVGSALPSNGTSPPTVSPQPGMPLTPSTSGYLRQGRLPDGIAFVGANVAGDARLQATVPEAAAALSTPAPPVVFYPDGTCSKAQVVLQNDTQRVVIVQTRSLTGSARLLEPLPDGSIPGLPSTTGGAMP